MSKSRSFLGSFSCLVLFVGLCGIASTASAATSFQLTMKTAGDGAGTVAINPANVSCGSTCTGTFSEGTSVTLKAAAKPGSIFTGWSGGCSGSDATCTVSLKAATSVTATFKAGSQLTVENIGGYAGRVISTPAGIDCPGECTATFAKGAAVVLTPAPEPGTTFAGWSGPCTGTGTCKLTLGESTTKAATTFEAGVANIASINHIIFFAQENRSLDNYFGAMRQYWKQNGFPDQSFDGLPQFNPTSGAAPLFKAPPALPGCNPNNPPPSDCVWDPTHTVASFHMKSVCNENTSPSWNEAHVDWNFNDQVGRYPPAKNNGFVKTAGHDARTNPGHPFFDVMGKRAMGYWDGTDLNYDYFMATNFATSDRFFHPLMARTEPNRLFLVAATSGGYALPNGSNANDTAQLKAKPIFAALQAAGISWKVYVDPEGTGCAAPYQTSCLIKHSYLSGFTYAQTIVAQFPQHIAPISQYFMDLQNGTLPQVAEIAPASDAGFDEHGSVTDKVGTNVQRGANYTRTLVTALMGSSSWSSSVFFFTFDESGGLYDHVSPQPAAPPDPNAIAPVDIPPNSVCYTVKGPTCNFTFTGYRIPLVVISPFAKKNYVSHTVADFTAILKFIETRYGLPPLTNRDKAQMDMTEFFNFNSPPWMSPPAVPAQNRANPCYLDRVP
jgi:phospholipase C